MSNNQCSWTSQSVPLLHVVTFPTVCVRPGYWVSSLLSNDFQGNTGPTKPLRPRSHAAPPQLPDFLTGSFSSSLRCTKARHAYLLDRQLVSYANVIAWNGTSWRWQLPDLPCHLLEALWGLTLPVSDSVPVFPGKAWHITDPKQHFWVQPDYRNPYGLHLQHTPWIQVRHIVYRHWLLPLSVLSPICGQLPASPQLLSSIMVLSTSTPGFRIFLDATRYPTCVPLGSLWSHQLGLRPAPDCPLPFLVWTAFRTRWRSSGYRRTCIPDILVVCSSPDLP